MAWNTLIAEAFRPYSERPTSKSGWASAILSMTGVSVKPTTIYTINESDSGFTAVNTSGRIGYIAYGSNANNTSFDIYFVGTCSTTSMGPFYFTLTGGSSRAADYGGYSSSIGRFGVWRVGSLHASSRDTTFKFDNFKFFALPNDANNGYESTESYTLSSALRNWANDEPELRYDGAEYTGCVDITAEFSVGSTITMGKNSVVANISSTNSSKFSGFGMRLTTLNGVELATGTSTINYNKVLPYSLESYFLDNELRRETNLQLVISHSSTSNSPLCFINGKWQQHSGSFTVSSNSFSLEIDKTKLPTFTSIAGQKVSNHNSAYVMLVNGYDKINFQATVNDQSYPYNNDPNNYSPTFALYCGDVNLGNYRPASVNKTSNTLTTTYDGSWGPMSVNPPVSLGVNQAFSAVYQDRFGRQAQTNINLTYNSSSIAYVRFYNYTTPTFTMTGQRVNSSGVPDEKNGTYIKINYDWALSLLDYSMSPHTGTNRPTVNITNSQDTTSHNYTITAASGSNSFTLSNKPIDKSYTFTMKLTDAAGRIFTISCFVASGEVFMDFMAGGSGLGIGKRAEMADKLSVGWDTDITGDLKVDGDISGPTITDIYDKISKAGSSSGSGTTSITIPSQTVSGTTTISGGSGETQFKSSTTWRSAIYPLQGSDYAMIIALRSWSGTSTITLSLPYAMNSTMPYYTSQGSLSSGSVVIGTGSNKTTTGYVMVVFFTAKSNVSGSSSGGSSTATTSITIPAQTVDISGGSGGGMSQAQVEAAIKAGLADYPKTSVVQQMINNSAGGLTSADVNRMIQDATILATKVSYSNTNSGMTATTVQSALDELKRSVDTKANSTVLGDYYKKTEVDNLIPTDFYSKREVDQKIAGIDIGEVDLSNYYTKSQVDNKIDNINIPEVNLTNYYTKSEIDNKISTIVPPEVNLSNYYTKAEIDQKFDSIPETDLTNFYTKAEVEQKIAEASVPEADLSVFYTKSEVDQKISQIKIPEVDLTNYYTKSQVDGLIPTDFYTKSQVDALIPTDFYSKRQIDQKFADIDLPDLTPYSTTTQVQKMIEDAISAIINVNEVKF